MHIKWFHTKMVETVNYYNYKISWYKLLKHNTIFTAIYKDQNMESLSCTQLSKAWTLISNLMVIKQFALPYYQFNLSSTFNIDDLCTWVTWCSQKRCGCPATMHYLHLIKISWYHSKQLVMLQLLYDNNWTNIRVTNKID